MSDVTQVSTGFIYVVGALEGDNPVKVGYGWPTRDRAAPEED